MRRPLSATACALLAAATLSAAPASAQGIGGLLPNVGTDPTAGNIRPQLERFLQPQTSLVGRPAWLFTPAIETDFGVTDNVYRAAAPRRTDVFTLITPQLVVSGDTAHVTANLAYSPQFTVYANTGSQTQVAQYFNGQALATILPDAVFLDLRGSITQSSLTNGGFNQVQTQSYGNQNTVQTETFSISPYATQRFGGWGTGTVRYTFTRSLQDNQGNQNNQPFVNTSNTLNSVSGQSGYGSVGNLSTSTEYATFTTGENFGRYNLTPSVSATQYSGSGSYNGAYRNEAQVQLAYAINHKFSLTSSIGYQDLAYAGTPASFGYAGSTGYRFNGATYSVGFTYAPNPDTKLSIQYGRLDGGDQVSFDGEFSPSPRTRFLARYSTAITSDLQQSQSQLANTTVGNSGIVTDTRTGAPVTNGGYNGLQNGVYRLNRFSATLLYLQERDSYSFSIGNDQRTTLTTTPTYLNNGLVPAGTNTNSTYASVQWQHDLSPDMNFSTSAQYGISTNTGQLVGAGNQNSATLSLSAILSRTFTQTLTGSLRYTYANVSGGQVFATSGLNNAFNTGNYSVNTLLVGLHKSF